MLLIRVTFINKGKEYGNITGFDLIRALGGTKIIGRALGLHPVSDWASEIGRELDSIWALSRTYVGRKILGRFLG